MRGKNNMKAILTLGILLTATCSTTIVTANIYKGYLEEKPTEDVVFVCKEDNTDEKELMDINFETDVELKDTVQMDKANPEKLVPDNRTSNKM